MKTWTMANKTAKNREKEFSVDLDEVFSEHAWKKFREHKNPIKKLFCRRSQYYTDVRWGYVEFKHVTTRFDVRSEGVDSTLEDVSTTPQDSDILKPKVQKDVTLYKSEYENRTQSPQCYSFNTTRSTTASTSVEFQESYTKGGECNIEISVPGDIVTVGAGLSGELSVTKTEGETFESTVSWTADTQINVDRGHTTIATIKVSERTSMADFEVQTTLSITDGKDLPVAIRRVSDDNIVGVVIIPDLRDVFFELEKINDNISFLKHKDTTRKPTRVRHDVILTSRGICKSISWKNQRVEVNSEKIPGFVIEEETKK